jgi:serine/threonine protein kinase
VLGVRYRIEEPPIGQGGMGVVYKAFDNVTKRFVAVKTVRGPVDHSSIELFEKEWTLLSRLCHPNIVDILDIGEFAESGQQKPYFVMPLLPGTTLDKLIKTRSQRLTPERTIEIICQACRGLQAAHDYGLVHRDLKPSNLFVMDDDTVKIIDFGVVHLSDAQTATGIKGTLQYMAPEQLEMKPTTSMSDIFSLGVVCYEALTGRKPFDRNSEAEVVNAIRSCVPPPASELNPSISDPVSRSVHKAMAKQPYHRFSSAREFAETLQRASRNEHIELFDAAKIQPRINRIKKALGEGDDQFAMEILTELESEGNIDPQISVLRIQVEQAIRGRTIRQLLDGARTRLEEEEYPLALQKVQSVLDIDPTNVDALAIKKNVERQRSAGQINRWSQIARQHLENQLFPKARQAVEEILKIDHSNKLGRELLAEINRGEQETARVRQEKQQLYESALTSYRNGEISSALSKLERMLELGKKFPGHPHTDAQYQAFYNQIRSERDELHNSYAEGRKALEGRNFDRALEICREVLTRRPGEPMFQSLKIEVEEAQRQESSAAIAQLNSRVESEADLDRKLAILQEAIDRFPGEQLFQHSIKLVNERRDLVNSIVARARIYEEQDHFIEALGQWDILRNIYGQYPGLDHEIRRVQNRREERAREEAKAAWVERIDRALASGRYSNAKEFTETAMGEFPGDGELVRLKQQAEQALQKSERVEALFSEAQEFIRSRNYAAAIDKLRQARQVDEKNPDTLPALGSALIEQARSLASTDWRAALPFVAEALEINPSDPGAKNASLLIEDARRREMVDRYLMAGRELQTAADLKGALDKVEQGLREYPNEIRLSQLCSTLRMAIEQQILETQRRPAPVKPERPVTAAVGAVATTPVTAEIKQSEAYDPSRFQATALFSEQQTPKPLSAPLQAHVPPSDCETRGAPAFAALPRQQRRTRMGDDPEEGLAFWKKIVLITVVVLVAIAGFAYYRQGAPGAVVKAPATAEQAKMPPVAQKAAAAKPSQTKIAPPQIPAMGTPSNIASSRPDTGAADQSERGPEQAAAQSGVPVMFHFTSTPAPARVIVDDNTDLVCQTPCYLPIAAGRHTLAVSAPNYGVSKRVLQVPEQSSAFVALAQTLEEVQVDSTPTGANVFIDGLPKGRTPAHLRLSAGPHQVRVVNDDWKDERTIQIEPGSLNSFTFKLGP